MPEITEPLEIIFSIKCAHCFTEIIPHDKEREHFAFCSDTCRMGGRLFPDEKHMLRVKRRKEWYRKNKEKVRAASLRSYHKHKKLTGNPVGRPRKVVDK